jgi:prevent-host-death family protein
MRIVNIHKAKMHLSRLVDQAAKGEPFVIAKAGKKLVRVTALDAPSSEKVQRLGFMTGQILVPDDFDQMGSTEIAALFGDNTA